QDQPVNANWQRNRNICPGSTEKNALGVVSGTTQVSLSSTERCDGDGCAGTSIRLRSSGKLNDASGASGGKRQVSANIQELPSEQGNADLSAHEPVALSSSERTAATRR
ncbi:MAG: hypothetical protein ACK559_37900, partial [bacterium]